MTFQYTITSLFIAVSLLVSACSPSLPPAKAAPNQTAPNATKPEPPPTAAAIPNTTPTNPTVVTPPPTPITTPTPAPVPTPNTTPIVTPPIVTPPPTPTPNTTPNTTPEPPPPNATLISYAKKVQRIFDMFCASPTCHDGTGNTTLNLQPAVSYKQLVNVSSDFLKSKLRVKPGAPEQSVIMIMVNDPEHATVTPSVIDTIKQWILEGANNN